MKREVVAVGRGRRGRCVLMGLGSFIVCKGGKNVILYMGLSLAIEPSTSLSTISISSSLRIVDTKYNPHCFYTSTCMHGISPVWVLDLRDAPTYL